jgi:alkyl hydroperoxide reductase subunit AhpF
MNRKNEARSLETVVSPKRVPGKHRTSDPDPKPADYDVLVVGGGPAGLAAAACCGRKMLRTGNLPAS